MNITRRNFLSAAAAGGVAPFACSRKEVRRPNVVVVMTDDQRWDCLGVAGHPFLKTPHMDTNRRIVRRSYVVRMGLPKGRTRSSCSVVTFIDVDWVIEVIVERCYAGYFTRVS